MIVCLDTVRHELEEIPRRSGWVVWETRLIEWWLIEHPWYLAVLETPVPSPNDERGASLDGLLSISLVGVAVGDRHVARDRALTSTR